MKKNSIYFVVMLTTLFVTCNGHKSTVNRESSNSIQNLSLSGNEMSMPVSEGEKGKIISAREIVNIYLELKDALAKDNPAAAAKSGNSLVSFFKKFDKTALSADQKKKFDDIEGDAVENAEHISNNSVDIEHQRKHFELLSRDIYDLVKIFGGGQVLYKIFCPMYNNGKGAYWLSGSSEIQNPYYGKEMLTCGTVQEKLN